MTNARRLTIALLLAAVAPTVAGAQVRRDTATKIEIYGYTQADAIYDFRVNNPDWFDVMRPSRLPAFEDEFGENNHNWWSVRQTRFGVKASVPTPKGPDFKVTFEWELFGVGVDAGQTTFRLRHAYGEWGKFGAGQTWSPFMDIDVFPNSLEYWGPNGMAFFRNVQVFWRPINRANGTRATIALERPGASGDGGIYADRVELDNIFARFPAPDISGEYRSAHKWGYIEAAGIVRWIRWDDILPDTFDLGGRATGWGATVTSNIKIQTKNVIRLQLLGGEAIENYFNDAPVDIGIKNNFGNPRRPIIGVPLPAFGAVAFLDRRWDERFSTAIGYSRVDIDNSDGQLAAAFSTGQYALVNLLYYPAPSIMMGGEFQWGYRSNFRDHFSANDYRLQFSFRYNYSQKFGGTSR